MNSRVYACILAVVAAVCGCSGDTEGRKPTHAVSGKVIFNGGPVVGAFVSFAPREGQPVATGRTDNSGRYTLTTYETGDGAVEGNFVAVVTKIAEAKAADAGGEHGVDVEIDVSGHGADDEEGSASLLPAKYGSSETSDLEVTVKAGEDNEIELPLNAN